MTTNGPGPQPLTPTAAERNLEAYIKVSRPELLDAYQLYVELFIEGGINTKSAEEARREARVSADDLKEVADIATRFDRGATANEVARQLDEADAADADTNTQDLARRYTEEGGYQGVFVTPDGTILAVDPDTGQRDIELDNVEYNPNPVSQGQRRFDPISQLVVPTAPAEPLPYLLDPTYQITIDPDDFFAMLRWLDPEVKDRLDDQEKVQKYFADVDLRLDTTDVGKEKTYTYDPISSSIQTRSIADFPGSITVGGKYADGDEARLFVTKSPEYIAYIQGLMVQGNILTADDVAKSGSWGMAEEAAIKAHLYAADERGMAIEQWLEEVAANPLPPEQPVGFTQPVYLAPDYATLSQNVKNVFRTQLGREPEPYEMGDLIRQLEIDHYADYQSQVDAARMEWEARQRASETGQEQATGTVQGVDPFSRMKEYFDKQYGPERERAEDVAEHGANVGLVMNNLAGLERGVTG